MSGTIFILLPVHNRREVTRRFIAALKAQTWRDYHLVLIDDGSSDGTAEMVRGEVPGLTVITGTGRWWWAGALQQGYEWLRGQSLAADDLVLIINDDTEFAPDFLEQAAGLMKNRRKSLLLARPYSRQTGRLIGGGVHVDWRTLTFSWAASADAVNCCSTRGLFLWAGDFLETGGFYPRLLPHYLSDYEFTMRAHRNGLELVVSDALRLSVDETTTGYQLGEDSPRRAMGRYFSKKSKENPFSWSAFVLLACPWTFKLTSLARVWYGTGKKLVGKLVASGGLLPWS